MRTLRRLFLFSMLALLPLAAAVGAGAQNVSRDFKVPAPDLPAGQQWLNSPALTMEKLRGKVVLIDFWEYTCVNCIRTFPYLKSWHEKYKDKGLVIIGVHTPEFHFAKRDVNVAKAAKDFGLSWPIINDNQHAVWNAYGNRYWPAKYLIDHQGFVRYFHFGEGAYEATEEQIQRLLKAANPQVELPAITAALRGTDKPGAVCYPVTPELYLGAERGGFEGTLANREGYRPGQTVTYRDPGNWEDGYVYLSGAWNNTMEAVISTRATNAPTDYVAIKYHALEVNSVLRPEEGKPVKVLVFHDGRPVAQADRGADIKADSNGQTYLLVDEPRMYNIIKNAKFGQRKLKLAPTTPGMGIYSFTFVSCEVPKK
ncbi:MAG: redoxin domain-containing protein [Armatimonadota bacterium]